MPAEHIVAAVVEVVVALGAHAASEGRAWLDKRELEKLDDNAKQAFIAGLVFVAIADGGLSESELAEIDERLRKLDIEEQGREVALVIAAREEVAAAMAGDEAAYAKSPVERIPEARRLALARRGEVIVVEATARPRILARYRA